LHLIVAAAFFKRFAERRGNGEARVGNLSGGAAAGKDAGDRSNSLIECRRDGEDGIVESVKRAQPLLGNANVVAGYLDIVVVLERAPDRVVERQGEHVRANHPYASQIGKRRHSQLLDRRKRGLPGFVERRRLGRRIDSW